MKFQDPSMHGSQDMACMFRTDARTDAWTAGNQYAPSVSLKLGV